MGGVDVCPPMPRRCRSRSCPNWLRLDLAFYIKFKLFHSGHIFGYDRLLLASTMYFTYNHTKNIRSEIKIIFCQQ